MAYRLIVSRRAEREADEAYQGYEDQLPGLGADFLTALGAQLDLIAQSPLIYAEVVPGMRRALLAQFPYGIFFASRAELISILAVVHTSRNPHRWRRWRREIS